MAAAFFHQKLIHFIECMRYNCKSNYYLSFFRDDDDGAQMDYDILSVRIRFVG